MRMTDCLSDDLKASSFKEHMFKSRHIALVTALILCSAWSAFAETLWDKRTEASPQKATSPAEEHFEKGVAYGRSGNTDEAIQEYQKAIELDPQMSSALFNMGGVYARGKQWQEAASCYERVLDLNPKDAEAHFNLATAYGALQRPLEALDHYDQSQSMGYQGDPLLAQLLEPYRDKDFTLEYVPLNDPVRKVNLHIRGSFLGSKVLVQDVIGNLQLVDDGLKQGTTELIQVQFLKWESDDVWHESWKVKTGDSLHEYPIRFVRSPEGGTDIQIVVAGQKSES
jgi:hypothetical protein